jgi:lipopolysaccharide biosynthesis protein
VFVSADDEAKRPAIEAALARWPGRREIRVTPNRGRNIAPQLVGFRDVYPAYDLVLLLHTKASAHTDELAGWRSWILASLLPSKTGVRHLLEAFERLPQLGMAAPAIYPQSRRHMVWSPNFAACRELADRLGVALAPDSPLDFPAGAMFWARPAALAPLLGLALRFEDFEDEAGQQDATLAHAVERLFFYACELAGRRWIRVGGGGEIWPDRWFRPDSPLALRRCVTGRRIPPAPRGRRRRIRRRRSGRPAARSSTPSWPAGRACSSRPRRRPRSRW